MSLRATLLLTGVFAIANVLGEIISEDGRRLVFYIIVNGIMLPAAALWRRVVIQRTMKAIARGGEALDAILSEVESFAARPKSR